MPVDLPATFPTRELTVVAGVFALGFLLGLVGPLRRAADRAVVGLGGWLRGRGLFALPDPRDAQFHLDTFRVVLAALVLWRYAGNRALLATLAQGGTPFESVVAVAAPVLWAMLLLGVATPAVALTLLVTNNLVFDFTFYTSYNLASNVISVALIPLALAPAGRALSVDAALLRLGGWPGWAVGKLYRLWGPFGADRAAVARFAALVGYSGLCLYSCLNHLLDPDWRSGLINAKILITPTTNLDYWSQVDAVYRWSPAWYVRFGQATTYGMVAWEALLLPMAVLNRWTRRLAVLWGLGFFALSAGILNLGFLPLVEIALWGMLFLNLRRPRRAEQAAEVPAPAPGRLFLAASVAMLAALAAFAVRLPLVSGWGPIPAVAEAADREVGRAGLVFGLGPVIVFDSRYDEFSTRVFFHIGWPEAVEKPRSDGWYYRMRRKYFAYTAGTGALDWSDPQALRDTWAVFEESYAIDPARRPGSRPFFAWVVSEGPDADALRNHEYKPRGTYTICRVDFDPVTGEPGQVQYYQDGVDALLRKHRLPFRVRAEGAPLARRFPVEEEFARLAYWHDCGYLGGRITPAVTAALVRAVEARQNQEDPTRVLAHAEAAVREMGLDWDGRANPLPAHGAMAADVALAEAYYARAFDDRLRAETKDHILAVRRAAARQDLQAVLLGTAAIRRAYFDRVLLDGGDFRAWSVEAARAAKEAAGGADARNQEGGRVLYYAFTDSTPFYEFAVYLVTLGGCLVLTAVGPVRRAAAQATAGAVGVVRSRGLFALQDPSAEQQRLDLIRVATGAFAVARTGANLETTLVNGDPLFVGVAAAAFGLSVMLCVGLFTPVAAGLLALTFNLLLDNVLSSSTLSSLILTMTAVVFALAPAGRSFSLDAWLMRRGWLGGPVRAVYDRWGPLTVERAATAKLLALLAYAGINFSAGLLHLQYDSWRYGLTTAWSFLNPVAAPTFSPWFDQLYRASPELFLWISRASVYGTLVYQLAFVPLLLLSRWTRRVVIGLELGFVFGSIFILNLSYLGWYQVFLILILFGDYWPARRAGTEAGAPSPGFRFGDRLALAAAISFVLMAAAFAVRLPYVRDAAAVKPAAALSKKYVGRAPLVFGLDQVDAFNYPLLGQPMYYMDLRWEDGAGGPEEPVISVPSNCGPNRVSDIAFYQNIIAFCTVQRTALVPTAEQLKVVLDRPGMRGITARYRDRGGVFHIDWRAYDVPTADDFLSRRYSPPRVRQVARYTFDARTTQPTGVRFEQEGLELPLALYGLPHRVRAERFPMLLRFPAAAEAKRLGAWFDRPDVLPRSDAATPLVVTALSNHPKDPLVAYREVSNALDMLDLDWRSGHLPPHGPWTTDLDLARVYYNQVFDDALRAETRADYERAERAAAKGDVPACLTACAAVRRAFVRAVRLPAD